MWNPPTAWPPTGVLLYHPLRVHPAPKPHPAPAASWAGLTAVSLEGLTLVVAGARPRCGRDGRVQMPTIAATPNLAAQPLRLVDKSNHRSARSRLTAACLLPRPRRRRVIRTAILGALAAAPVPSLGECVGDDNPRRWRLSQRCTSSASPRRPNGLLTSSPARPLLAAMGVRSCSVRDAQGGIPRGCLPRGQERFNPQVVGSSPTGPTILVR